MAKKDNDNFDFETEGKAKASLDLSFLKNLTKKQKGIILGAVIGIVLVIAIVVTCVLISANDSGNNSGNNAGNSNDNNNGTSIPEEISTLDISAVPKKIVYRVGDDPDYSGLSVYFKSEELPSGYIYYDLNPEEFTITGFDSTEPIEEQVITVECKGFTDTFTVKIEPALSVGVTLAGITMKALPTSFVSTILSSTSLILSSASVILLLVPSTVFFISFIALFSID